MNRYTEFVVFLFVAVFCGLFTPSMSLARRHSKGKCYTGQLDLGYGVPIGTRLTVCFEGYPAASDVISIRGLDEKSVGKRIRKLNYGFLNESRWAFDVPLRWTMKAVDSQVSRMVGLGSANAAGQMNTPAGIRDEREAGPEAYPYFVITVVDSSGKISGTLYPLARVRFDQDGQFQVSAIASPAIRVSGMREVKP
ncbi:MAG TPA: hypothetical protein VNM47_15405 [Terriglobia bacterium]|nr:hypothetical protein [Terriglobia bacterium]